MPWLLQFWITMLAIVEPSAPPAPVIGL